MKETAKGLKVKLLLFSDKKHLKKYINSLKKDPITDFVVFSHGYKRQLAFGHKQGSKIQKKSDLTINDIKDLKSEVFNSPLSTFYSCNYVNSNVSGIVSKKKFAQEWANKTGGNANAVVGEKGIYGRTWYGNINSTSNPFNFSQKLKSRNIRKANGSFSPLGSINYPIPAIETKSKWKIYKPQNK